VVSAVTTTNTKPLSACEGEVVCTTLPSFIMLCVTCESRSLLCAGHAMAFATPMTEARCSRCGTFLAPHIYPIGIAP
jgi:hypothetical protein